MKSLRRLRSVLIRLRDMFRGDRANRDVAAELDAHLQMHIDDNLRAGMSPADARRAALMTLGGLDQTKEQLRDRLGVPAVDHILRDLRDALRLIRRNPGLSCVAILTLAIGIGFNSTLFTIVDALLFRPLPIDRPDRLVNVYTSATQGYAYGTSSTIGAIAGIGLASLLLRLGTGSRLPLPISVPIDVALDGRMLVVTAAVSIIAGVVAGLAPAWRATKPDVIADLGGQPSTLRIHRRRWTLRDGLVILQIAATLILLVSSGLMTRSLIALQAVDLGFRTQGVATVSMALTVIGYSDDRARQFLDRAVERVRAMPGVQSAALTWRLPLELNFDQSIVLIPDQHGAGDKGDPIQYTAVSTEYFTTLGVPLVHGRAFTAADTRSSPRVAIVNETMARRYWPTATAVGKRFRLRAWDGPEIEIVGVAADRRVVGPGPPVAFAWVGRSGASPQRLGHVCRTTRPRVPLILPPSLKGRRPAITRSAAAGRQVQDERCAERLYS